MRDAIVSAEQAAREDERERWKRAVDKVRNGNEYSRLAEWSAGFDAAIARILAEVETG